MPQAATLRSLSAALVAALLALVSPAASGQDDEKPPPKRYGIPADLRTFPQATPRETLASVLKAIEQRRVDYLLAHLADPRFVDRRVQELRGNFDDVVRETSAKLNEDPTALAELRRFLAEGDWKEEDATAAASIKELPNRRVNMKKVDNRWFLENRKRVEKES